VRAPRDGVVLEALVEPGSRVEAGTVLARLDARTFEAARAELEARGASLATRRAELEREARHRSETLEPAERASVERALEIAELVLETARAKETRLSTLTAQGLVERAELEDAVLARKLAEAGLETARAASNDVPARQAAARAELEARISDAGHALDEWRAQADEIERHAAQSELVAPVSGCVLGPSRAELAGRAVQVGDEVLRVAVAGVDAFLARTDDRGRARIREGASAKLRLEGYPWLVHGTLEARVTWIADRADERGWQVRLEVDPEHSPGPLYEGMSGHARIATEERASLGWLVLDELFGLESR